MSLMSLFKKNTEKKPTTQQLDEKAQRIAATGLSVSISLAVLLTGLSIVVLSLNNIQLSLKLKKKK